MLQVRFLIWTFLNSSKKSLTSMSTSTQTTITEMTKTSLTVDDIQNLLTLIDFHDDWDEVKDIWGFDIEPLFNKLNDMLQDA